MPLAYLEYILINKCLKIDVDSYMKAGVSKEDISPPIDSSLAGHTVRSTGVNDPLFVKALVIDDNENAIAFVCLDLVSADFDFCDWVRANISKKTGIKHVLVNVTHTHSAPPAVMRELGESYNSNEKKWLEKTKRKILDAVEKAYSNLMPVSLHVGRELAQVGYNRRLTDKNGFVQMKINKNGPVVPWVNVLQICGLNDKTIAVLFEHPSHPVIIHTTSSLSSADFPGFAAKRIEEEIGKETIAIFAQGCAGNINGYPHEGGLEKAEEAGNNLGDAVLKAMLKSKEIKDNKINIFSKRLMLPCQELPSWWSKKEDFVSKNSQEILSLIESGKLSNLRFDINTIKLGSKWCLVAMSHEVLCEYELWIDEVAPFDLTMVLGYTNGCESYVATDTELMLGEKGGYEAGSFPSWGIAAKLGYQIHSPLAVGTGGIIKKGISSLWNK
jgi:hypothetical protein